MPQISVIVPVYKAEAYLADCVGSILSQTFQDLEVILVDDGSPDNCGILCEEYAVRDNRIRVLHQKNQGQAAARNHALEIARGQWISFVDSDDRIHPQMLQLLYEGVQSTGAGISMCQMLEATSLPEDFFRSRNPEWEVLNMEEETLVQLHDREEYPAWVSCAKLIRRDLIDRHLFCPGRVYEDNEAVCHWVCAAGKLARIPDMLYFYRTNPESTTKRTFSEKKLDYLWALERIITFYDSLGYETLKQRFSDRYAQELANCCYSIRSQLNRPDLIKRIRRQGIRFARKQKLRFRIQQKEQLLDAMYPKLIRFYWPVAGIVRTLGETGISGLLKKIRKKLGKGEPQ